MPVCMSTCICAFDGEGDGMVWRAFWASPAWLFCNFPGIDSSESPLMGPLFSYGQQHCSPASIPSPLTFSAYHNLQKNSPSGWTFHPLPCKGDYLRRGLFKSIQMALIYQRELKRENGKREEATEQGTASLKVQGRKQKRNQRAWERVKIPFLLFSMNTAGEKIASDLTTSALNVICKWWEVYKL